MYRKSALMHCTKEELIDKIIMLEYNNKVLDETIEQQYKNATELLKEMDLFNETYKNTRNKVV